MTTKPFPGGQVRGIRDSARRGVRTLPVGFSLLFLALLATGCQLSDGESEGQDAALQTDLAADQSSTADQDGAFGLGTVTLPYSAGACGTAHSTPGCSNPACEACVCGGMFMCCQMEWSQECANQTAPGMPCHEACAAGCVPSCSGRQCGDDGCGGSCGSCNDANACSTDTCNASGQCSWVWKNCDDSNACTADSCNSTSGQCRNIQKNCDDNEPCTDDFCNPATGECLNEWKTCDDGDPCTNDSCMPSTGECLHFPNYEDDLNPCTVDGCDNGILTHVPVECPDGFFCVGGECALLPCLPRTGEIVLAGPPEGGVGMAGWGSDGTGAESARTGHAVPWTSPPHGQLLLGCQP